MLHGWLSLITKWTALITQEWFFDLESPNFTQTSIHTSYAATPNTTSLAASGRLHIIWIRILNISVKIMPLARQWISLRLLTWSPAYSRVAFYSSNSTAVRINYLPWRLSVVRYTRQTPRCNGRKSTSVVCDALQRRQWLVYPFLDVVTPR